MRHSSSTPGLQRRRDQMPSEQVQADLDTSLWENFFRNPSNSMVNCREPQQTPEEIFKCYGSLGSRQCSVRKAPVVVGSPPSFSSAQSNHRVLPADPSSARSSSSFHKQAGPALDRFPVYNHPASSVTNARMYPPETAVAPPTTGGSPAASSQIQEVFHTQHRSAYQNNVQNQSMQSFDHTSLHPGSNKNHNGTPNVSFTHSSSYPVITRTSGNFDSSQYNGGHGQPLPPLAHFNEYIAKTQMTAALNRNPYGIAASEGHGAELPTKRICAWNPADVASFFRAVARDNGQDPSRLNVGKLYGLDGPALLRLDEIDFLERDPMNGAQWYRALRKFVDRPQVGMFTPKMEPGETSPYVTDPHAPFLTSQQSSGPFHDDYSEYIQESFTKDEFDDIDIADSSVVYGNGPQQLHYAPSHTSQTFNGNTVVFQNFSPMSLCGTSMTSDGTETVKTDLDSDMESSRSCTRSSYTDNMSGQSLSSYNFESVSPRWSSSSPESSSSKRQFKPSPKSEKLKKSSSKHGTRGNHLWEFVVKLLKNPVQDGKQIIKWENKAEGVFRFVESEKVAKLWGQQKANPRMTYEKLSRAMRYYYKSRILLPVIGRRLVYQFGPKASGWRSSTC